MPKLNLKLTTFLCFIAVAVFLLLYYQNFYPLEALEKTIYATGLRVGTSKPMNTPRVVLIGIDDKSLSDFGSWPWPRSLIADMVKLVKESGARVIGLNLPLVEEQEGEGLKEFRSFHHKFYTYPFTQRETQVRDWVEENLLKSEERLDFDGKLARSVREAGNVILPLLGSYSGRNRNVLDLEKALLSRNSLKEEGLSKSLRESVSVKRLFFPFPLLARVSKGFGYRFPLLKRNMHENSCAMFAAYKNYLIPSFLLRIELAYLGKKPLQVSAGDDEIRAGPMRIPLFKGKMLVRFPRVGEGPPAYSFSDVLKKGGKLYALRGKIVLIGFTHRQSKVLITPFSSRISEIELFALALENILNKSYLVRPVHAPYVEALGLLVIGILVSLFFPRVGGGARLAWTIGLCAFILFSGFALLSISGIWIKTSYTASCVAVIFAVTSAGRLYGEGRDSRISAETNKLIGLSFQNHGLFDVAFDHYRKLPLDREAKELIYDLGLEYESRGMFKKALSAYEYINKGGGFRDLDERIARLQELEKSPTIPERPQAEGPVPTEYPAARELSRVGRYQILETLGRGSMGLVYKALDPKINRLVAIKTIRFSDEFDEEVIQEIKERFFREAEVAGKLSHTSIVTIYDMGEDEDLTYMAMEYLEGEDLEKFVNKKNLLPVEKVLHVVASIAEALDFAHSSGVIHRDIKPANVMLLKTGGVKVTDFGIAKAISGSRTKTGVILGTPNYMSPEQIMGHKIDHRSDIFSLGVLFFQLLCGELPFKGDNLSALLYQITQVKHPPLWHYNSKIPKICEQIIDKALAKDPKQRFQNAGELARVLRVLISKIEEARRKYPAKKQRARSQ
ncbi:MAG: hypothetical protein DRH11_04125 [Deltaproteobacteria bacterium]|nr:MAG: hypothetical protein DRH11_04125 [Deltaproteobacteria bacterium]